MSQPLLPATATVTIGADIFLATLRQDLAPHSCQRREELMPYCSEVLVFAGEQSEPELRIAYGTTRFASKLGPLEGNVVLTIEHRYLRLAELEREILWRGALRLRIE